MRESGPSGRIWIMPDPRTPPIRPRSTRTCGCGRMFGDGGADTTDTSVHGEGVAGEAPGGRRTAVPATRGRCAHGRARPYGRGRAGGLGADGVAVARAAEARRADRRAAPL